MKQYEIQYFNYPGQCSDYFHVMAKDEEDAKRIFRKMYNDEIEGIYEYLAPHFWTEQEVNNFIKNYR